MNKIPALFAAALAFALAAPAHAGSGRALVVVSAEGRDEGKTRPGFEMDEFAQTWLILRANGFEVDVASPAGGAVQADRFDAKEPFNAAVLADVEATRQLAATLRTDAVDAADYRAADLFEEHRERFRLAGPGSFQRMDEAIRSYDFELALAELAKVMATHRSIVLKKR